MTFRRTVLACLLVGAAIGAGMGWERNGGSAQPPDDDSSWHHRRDPALGDSIVAGYERSLGTWTTGAVTVRAPRNLLSPEEGTELARRLDERLTVMTRRLAGGTNVPAIPPTVVWCYPDFQTKGLRTGSARLEHAESDADVVHRVLERGRAEGDGLAEAELVLRRADVRLKQPWLRAGALVWLADSWLGVPSAEWCGRLAGMGVLPESAEMAKRFDELSTFIAWPAAGGVVTAAMAGRRAGLPPGQALAALDKALGPPAMSVVHTTRPGPAMPRFGGFLDAPGQSFAYGSTPLRGMGLLVDRPLHGVCFAHDHGLEWGYVSREAADNLTYLREKVNVSAISISPFGYLAGATDPVIRRFGRGRGGEDEDEETDESLVAVTARAHERGMDVLLAPHLWGRVWCGDWHAEDEAGWAALFASYREFATHYALLAAYCGADVYQVGKELKATAGREREWRDLIAQVRRIYPGAITYGANWDEYRHITWWDAVDLIGIDQYTPVATGEKITDTGARIAMSMMADSIDALSARVDRPWLLTEIGFTAAADGYREPWKSFDPAVDTGDPDRQAMLYEAALMTYLPRSRCRGLFWWKWFTRIESNRYGRNRFDYPPYGKTAERILAAHYGKRPEPGRDRERLYNDVVQATDFRLYRGLARQGGDTHSLTEWSRTELLRVEGGVFYPDPVALVSTDVDSLRAWSARQLDGGEPLMCSFHADWLLEWRAGDELTRQLVCLGCGEVRTSSHWASPRVRLSDPERAALDGILSKYLPPAPRQP